MKVAWRRTKEFKEIEAEVRRVVEQLWATPRGLKLRREFPHPDIAVRSFAKKEYLRRGLPYPHMEL